MVRAGKPGILDERKQAIGIYSKQSGLHKIADDEDK